MNIFVLSADPYKAAKDHCDKHAVKMIVESGQLLSTTLRFYGHSGYGLSKATHLNHQCAVWTRQSRSNFEWLCCLMDGLLMEYDLRYGIRKRRVHKSSSVYNECVRNIRMVPNLPATPHPKCMPDEYKVSNVVASYRNYYIGAKSHFATWNFSPTPAWYARGIFSR